MGVESIFYVMPAASGFCPEPDAMAALVRELHDSRFVGSDLTWTIGKVKGKGGIDEALAAIAAEASSDICLRWQTADLAASGLRYPLAKLPGPDGVYYDLEIHLAVETAYRTSEIVQPFEEIHCACGEAIAEDWGAADDPFAASRLPSACPACAAPIDYATLPMTMLDPMTGEPGSGHGGITYRCAVVIDCGKYLPDYGTPADPDLIAALTPVLGEDLRTVQDFY